MSPIRPFCRAAALVACLASPALAQPANDTCASPTPFSGLSSMAFDTNGATTDGLPHPGCLAFSVDQVSNDVWFCWTATAGGPVKARTCGASFDTRIAVYAGCTCPEGTGLIVCNDDACSLQSEAPFVATAGQSYLIRVGAYSATAFGSGTLEVASNTVEPLSPPITNPANNHQYVLLNPSSWTAARATAVSMGGDLVTINDAAENEWVRVELANYLGQDRRVWIGLNDQATEGLFVWADGTPVGYTNWSGGEPNNSGGQEHFAELFGSNGQWNDNRDTPLSVTVYGVVEMGSGPACPADRDGNGQVEPADIALFVSQWFNSIQNGTLEGDFDGNGSVQPSDVAGFVSVWFTTLTTTPCP